MGKTGATIKTKKGETNYNQVASRYKQGWCARPGGPVYTVNADGSVAAKGIISSGGGSEGDGDYYGGLFDQCHMAFTDIYDAYFGFPGVLKTTTGQ